MRTLGGHPHMTNVLMRRGGDARRDGSDTATSLGLPAVGRGDEGSSHRGFMAQIAP